MAQYGSFTISKININPSCHTRDKKKWIDDGLDPFTTFFNAWFWLIKTGYTANEERISCHSFLGCSNWHRSTEVYTNETSGKVWETGQCRLWLVI